MLRRASIKAYLQIVGGEKVAKEQIFCRQRKLKISGIPRKGVNGPRSQSDDRYICTGLPDGIFSNQKF
jgi:hypothetical protein